MEKDKEKEDKEIELKKTLKKSYKRSIIISIILILLGLGIASIIHESRFQSTDDAYIENHSVQVSPKVSGQLSAILVTDNQKIKEGTLVAKIDDADYKIKFDQANANYQKALLGQNVAKANLSAVQTEIKNSEIDLERYRNLYATGAVSKQQFDMAQTKYDGLKAKMENAEQMVLSDAENKVADADLKALKALRDQAQLNLSYTKIYAPQTGTVTNKKIGKGAYVQVGSPLFVIVPEEIWIVANFKESQIGLMKKNQEVSIKIDAYPNKIFKGKIDSIQRASGSKSSLFPPENAVGSFVKIVQRIPVKIVFDEKIDPSKYTIVPGMSVIPKVLVK